MSTSFDAPTEASPPQPPPAAAVPPPPAAVAPAGPPPAITPNRRRLDNRFPVLAFSIRTYGKPLFEVLLATDRALFEPANAARRTPGNFYAGRQDGGLLHATADETAYVVPAAVLKRFADARPRPGEIFYTVAVYEAPEGAPLLAQPPNLLATTAPSVLLGGDFQARTMASVLGVSTEKLQHVSGAQAATYQPVPPALGAEETDDDGIPVGEAASWSSEEDDERAVEQAAQAWESDPQALALDDTVVDEPPPAEADEWAASEGFGAPDDWSASLAEEPLDDDPMAQQYADEPVEPPQDEEQLAAEPDEDYDEPGGAAQAYAADEEPYPEAEEAGLDYDDGYGAAQESAFPAGSAEPAQLGDPDEDRVDEELAAEAYEEPYDEGEGMYSALGNGNGKPSGGVATPVAPAPAPAPVAPAAARPLDIPTKVGIVTKIGRKFESSGGYAGITADAEFSNPRLPQYQRHHIGLSYGFVQFTQDSGMLGRLLEMMRVRDPARFREIFGPDSDELVRVTTQRGPSGHAAPGGRSVRVQPIGGADLWQEPWLSRFRAAGAHPPFQAAQNELAVRAFVDPMLPFAAGLGMNSERALAMIVDRSIHLGLGGSRRWLIGAIGPIRTDAQRQQALGALGVPGVREFQQASGIRADGEFGPLTHAALAGALRRLGPASPVPLPTREQSMDAIVARADAEQVWWRRRPRAIRTDPDFADVELTWTSPPPGGGH